MYLCLRQRAIETGWWLYVESSFNTQIEAEYGSQKVFNRNLENCAIPQTSRKHRKFKNFFQSYEKKMCETLRHEQQCHGGAPRFFCCHLVV